MWQQNRQRNITPSTTQPTKHSVDLVTGGQDCGWDRVDSWRRWERTFLITFIPLTNTLWDHLLRLCYWFLPSTFEGVTATLWDSLLRVCHWFWPLSFEGWLPLSKLVWGESSWCTASWSEFSTEERATTTLLHCKWMAGRWPLNFFTMANNKAT